MIDDKILKSNFQFPSIGQYESIKAVCGLHNSSLCAVT